MLLAQPPCLSLQPEGLFLTLNVSADAWRVLKVGSAVDPFDVVEGGNHHQHGQWGGVAALQSGTDSQLVFASDDAGVAQFGPLWPLPTPVFSNSTAPDEGAAFFLVGNTWSTNYPQFIPWRAGDQAMQWRFSITAA